MSTFDIDKIIVHPDYNESVYYNDIALIKLVQTVEINNNHRPACLWQYNHFNFERPSSIGYGAHSFGKYARLEFVLTFVNIYLLNYIAFIRKQEVQPIYIC